MTIVASAVGLVASDPPRTLASYRAIGLDIPAAVDATYAALAGAGFDGHLAPWDAFWGQRSATLRDPDGDGVDLLAPLVAN